jgi:hypothetical protein
VGETFLPYSAGQDFANPVLSDKGGECNVYLLDRHLQPLSHSTGFCLTLLCQTWKWRLVSPVLFVAATVPSTRPASTVSPSPIHTSPM